MFPPGIFSLFVKEDSAMARIAGIGSRDLSHEWLSDCHKLGEWIVKCGHQVISGNATGADFAFASGGNAVDPSKVHLMLPWGSFNQGQIAPMNVITSEADLDQTERGFYLGLARKYHPRFDYLSQGAAKLHLRNGMILFPPAGNHPRPLDLVLAWPSMKVGGGGTGQGMRIARGEGIECIDLSRYGRKELSALCQTIRGMK